LPFLLDRRKDFTSGWIDSQKLALAVKNFIQILHVCKSKDKELMPVQSKVYDSLFVGKRGYILTSV
jgi:hypothetical protein